MVTKQATTWEDLRKLVNQPRKEGELQALARALEVNPRGANEAVRAHILTEIGKKDDLQETVENVELPAWVNEAWVPIPLPRDEVPASAIPPIDRRTPETEDEHASMHETLRRPRDLRDLSDEALEERHRETVAERATRRARENAEAQAEVELAEEEAARHRPQPAVFTREEETHRPRWQPPIGGELLRVLLSVALGSALAFMILTSMAERGWIDLPWIQAKQPVATQTIQPPSVPVQATPAITANAPDTGKMPDLPTAASHGSWNVQETSVIGNDPIVRDFLARMPDAAPAKWPTFPNIPNPKLSSSEFPVKNGSEVPWGAEYGVANVPFCQQDQRCDFVVPALHYRLITADYSFQGITCKGDGKKGCLLLLVNVGNVTQTWRNQMADNGFTVVGRYWDGNHLDTAMWGLVSHASANMLNMPTMASPDKVLNAGGVTDTNGGANCGVPNACNTVDATIVIHAGDRILAVAKSTVTK